MKRSLPHAFLLLITCTTIAVFLYWYNPFGLAPDANKVVAIAALMIGAWVTEALPMPVVALFPLVLFPIFGIAAFDVVTPSYANPVIFLFMGGFMLGLAIEKWNLHRRIALNIVRITGTSGDRIILGFIIATGLISMWLSNTATTMMMFPIALSVIHVLRENHPHQKGITNFSLSVMIAIALASNIGGIATIIGTPPNVAYTGFILKKYNYAISFLDWMLLCMPLSLLMLTALYWVMVKWLYPNGMQSHLATSELIRNEINLLGPFSKAEKRVLTIFITVALLWITRDLINKLGIIKLDDNMIALMGAIALFIVQAGNGSGKALMDWADTKNMAWGILLLFGGGIALAAALEKAGLIERLGHWFAQFAFHRLLLIFLITFISLFISEVLSNVAQVIVFAPVVSGLAEAVHMHPLSLGIPMTLAASCASMLPMGTPPNAIVFSSGYIRLSQMTRIGFCINIIAVVLITLFGWLLLPLVFHVQKSF
ncbi:MAG: DASS family sodium-coupled anion symporter [Flavisolibacter sp.]|nr:DASS family sodium-coupled anion symporter [Flavisolibacter sp.]